MKVIKYQIVREVNHGTEDEPNIVPTFYDCEIKCSDEALEANEEIAKKEAYNGEYTIEDGGDEVVTAPSNITAGEYVTVNNVLYKATENIPNGERIIVGQNAIKTTVEAQLYELMGG